MAAATTGEITLKLLIDYNTEKVVFAEAKKDFVDYLFGLLQVPVGSIMGNLLANKMESAGSMARVYKSVMDLESSYLLTNVSRDLLLFPEMSSSSTSITIPPLLQSFVFSKKKSENETRRDSSANSSPLFGAATSATPIFTSSSSPAFFGATTSATPIFTSSSSSACFGATTSATPIFTSSSSPACFGATTSAAPIFGSSISPSFFSTNTVASPSKPEGFVRGRTQYMVMDDLTVKPLSPISSITLLNTIGVRDISCLVEKIVTINFNKGLEMVKASFVSDTVLSDVFVRNQPRRI